MKCQVIPDFPEGEFYSRRKPKGASVYSNLEERLADDIFELSNCLDTGIVTAEIRNMFKPNSVIINDVPGEDSPVKGNYTLKEISSFSTLLNRSSLV